MTGQRVRNRGSRREQLRWLRQGNEACHSPEFTDARQRVPTKGGVAFGRGLFSAKHWKQTPWEDVITPQDFAGMTWDLAGMGRISRAGSGNRRERAGILREASGKLQEEFKISRERPGKSRADPGISREGSGILREPVGTSRERSGTSRVEVRILRPGTGTRRPRPGISRSKAAKRLRAERRGYKTEQTG
jgi:hypothetical protein